MKIIKRKHCLTAFNAQSLFEWNRIVVSVEIYAFVTSFNLCHWLNVNAISDSLALASVKEADSSKLNLNSSQISGQVAKRPRLVSHEDTKFCEYFFYLIS